MLASQCSVWTNKSDIYATAFRDPSTAVLIIRRPSTRPILHCLCCGISWPQCSCTHYTTPVHPPCFTLFITEHQQLARAIRQSRSNDAATATELLTLCLQFLTCWSKTRTLRSRHPSALLNDASLTAHVINWVSILSWQLTAVTSCRLVYHTNHLNKEMNPVAIQTRTTVRRTQGVSSITTKQWTPNRELQAVQPETRGTCFRTVLTSEQRRLCSSGHLLTVDWQSVTDT